MAFDGNGTYNAPSPEYPAVSGTPILASDFNTIISDIATALSNCMVRDGQGVPTGHLAMGGYGFTNLGDVSFAAGKRIKGDFSNATLVNRVMFQTTTTNDTTSVCTLPNGSGVGGNWTVFAGTDPANSAYVQMNIGATAATVASSKTGSGTVVKLVLNSTAGVYLDEGAEFRVGYRSIPRSTSNPSAASDVGKCIAATSNITVLDDTYAAGDALSIYNDSASAISIYQDFNMTLRLAGTANTGHRTLAARGFCTVWFNSTNEAVIMGSGLS